MKLRASILSILVVLLMAPAISQADIAVVVRADSVVPYEDLLIEKIFLTQTYVLPDGGVAAPVHQKDGSDIHSHFMLTLLNKAPSYIRSAWSKLTFTGGLKPVKELSNDDAVLKYVESTPNGIGYVDSKSVKGNVKVVMKL